MTGQGRSVMSPMGTVIVRTDFSFCKLFPQRLEQWGNLSADEPPYSVEKVRLVSPGFAWNYRKY